MNVTRFTEELDGYPWACYTFEHKKLWHSNWGCDQWSSVDKAMSSESNAKAGKQASVHPVMLTLVYGCKPCIPHRAWQLGSG